MPNIGPMEIAIVLIIALIVLGPKRLPGAGRSLGKGIREFKDSIDGSSAEPELKVRTVQAAAPVDEEPAPAAPLAATPAAPAPPAVV